MKIRMKHNHAVVEEVDSRMPLFGFDAIDVACLNNFARKGRRDGQWEVFSGDEWEPVQEEKWVDVTIDCVWTDEIGLVHIQNILIANPAIPCNPANGYRMRTQSFGSGFRIEKRIS